MVLLEDSEHPWHWSTGKKAWVTAWTSGLVFNSTIASSAPSGFSAQIRERYHVSAEANVLIISMFLFGYVAGPAIFAPISEAYGRRPVFIAGLVMFALANGLCAAVSNFGALLFFRFLSGVAGSPPLTNSGATIGDIFPPEKRGIPMALFSLAPFAGPALGPLLAGFISPGRLGYKFMFVIFCSLSVICAIISFFFLPETYAPTLRYHKAKGLRKSGQAHMHSELDLQRKNWKSNLLVWLYRPAQMIVTEPILATMTL